MIDLTVLELDKFAKAFYRSVEEDVKKELTTSLPYLNGFTTFSEKKLGEYLKTNIEKIITSDLGTLLDDIHPELKTVFKEEYGFTSPKKPNDFKKCIDKILHFEKHDKWGAYSFTRKVGVDCCPYCNRTYITTLGTDNKKLVRSDIDHFLAKSKYPYFRFSFYNLVPSCVICNRNAKGKSETKLDCHIHPYIEGFGDKAKFVYKPMSYKGAVGRGESKIKFAYYGDRNENKKIKGNVKLFRLEEQYSIHQKELNHLIQLKEVHSRAYLQDILEKYDGLINSKEEAYLLAFGKEYNHALDYEQPLSKFTRDILEDLGMLDIFK